jgi:membrane-bound lytic murein transglycosylase D
LTKRWLTCCLGAAVFLTGCATAEKQKTVVNPPPPPPPRAVAVPPTTAKKSSPPPPTAPAPQNPAQLLVKQVEDLYAVGMNDYRAGNLEKAKDEFDQALATLLESDLNIQSDERLTSEFDNIVENIYDAEAASLEHGDSLSPHNYEPAPLDAFSGLTFPVDPHVKERAMEELKSVHSDLPLVSNDYVDGVLTYLQNHARGYINNVLKRGGLYHDIIAEALQKEGLPQDLIYLAAGESALNPLAVSKTGAKGIWQFMPGTGALYGLKRDRWVDDRLDPVKSTAAAARTLKDLYRTFGDWFLAMAAYDSGPLTVQRAIEKTGYADYWELRRLHALPAETENYVPVFLATALIAKDPKAYGFDTPPDPPLALDRVKVETPTDLRLIAQLIDRTVEELVTLNPSLQRWTTPANEPGYVLNLPAGTKDLFERNVGVIPADKRIWWRAHKVGGGETLATIAKELHVSPAALAQVNQLAPGGSLEEGSHLVVPLAPGKDSSLVRVRERVPTRLAHYRVRPGDTVDLIADRFEVTAYQIRRWNNIKNPQLAPGRILRLYVEPQSVGASKTSSSKAGTKAGRAPATRKTNSAQASLTRKKPPISGSSSAHTATLAVQ